MYVLDVVLDVARRRSSPRLGTTSLRASPLLILDSLLGSNFIRPILRLLYQISSINCKHRQEEGGYACESVQLHVNRDQHLSKTDLGRDDLTSALYSTMPSRFDVILTASRDPYTNLHKSKPQ